MAEQFSHLLNPVKIKKLVHSWILEDSAHFDFGGFVVGEQQEQAHLLGKSHGILAGSPFVDAVFQELNCSVNWLMSEGSQIEPICTVAVVSGPVRHLLLGERIALNCLARTSGIATYCKKLADIAAAAGWKGRVAGTRKTTPGFRLPEKYAMIVGGIDTHRYDLSSMIMLKDNHITSLGSIQKVSFHTPCLQNFLLGLSFYDQCQTHKNTIYVSNL
jgi:nicotinate-nucleotide pyrophosphorylase (carboxylating)